jgi:hypothetical protein
MKNGDDGEMIEIPDTVALVHSAGTLPSEELESVAEAMTLQAHQDFAPVWNVKAPTVKYQPAAPDAGWYIELIPHLQKTNAGGFHKTEVALEDGIPALVPYATIDLGLVTANGGHWSVAASHELLEMLADPVGDRYSDAAAAPGGFADAERVPYLIEVCDPCAPFSYQSGGAWVSDFVTPAYYSSPGEAPAPYSFKENINEPLQVLKGGYVTFRDPKTKKLWWKHFRYDGQMHIEPVPRRYLVTQSPREGVDEYVREHEEAWARRSSD